MHLETLHFDLNLLEPDQLTNLSSDTPNQKTVLETFLQYFWGKLEFFLFLYYCIGNA